MEHQASIFDKRKHPCAREVGIVRHGGKITYMEVCDGDGGNSQGSLAHRCKQGIGKAIVMTLAKRLLGFGKKSRGNGTRSSSYELILEV